MVLFAVDGYSYGGRHFDILEHVEQLRGALPELRATVLVPHLDPAARLDGARSWAELTSGPADPLDFEPRPRWPLDPAPCVWS